MTPDAVVQAYVSEVARLLPRARRNDVALELHALLSEELQGKADAQQRQADEAMALELVRSFGAPEVVAERYLPTGFVVIPSIRTKSFTTIAAIGVGLQWLITLPDALLNQPGREFVSLGAWWLSHGIGALWWPGFMITVSIIAAWLRHRWPPAKTTSWRPRDTDSINRPLWVLSAVASLLGVATLVSASWVAENFLPSVATIFLFDQDFIPVVGAVVVTLWIGTAVHALVVFSEGRWRRLTRQLELALGMLWFAALVWLVIGPRIYLAPATDKGAKDMIGLVALLVLIDLAVKLYRYLKRPHAQAALAVIIKTQNSPST